MARTTIKKGEWLIMAEYGTPEWYEEQIKENTREKTILVHALCDVSRQQFVDYSLIEDIAKRIADKSSSIKWQKQQLKDLLGKQKNKENE